MVMRARHSRITVLMLALVMMWPALARADVKLPAVFGRHMVLQRDRGIPVWGWAAPRERVMVKLGNQAKHTTADAKGNWRVTLDAMPAGGPHKLVITARNEIVLDDVLIGEVWVCSGQSNMAWPVSRAKNAKQEIAAADYPKVRLITVSRASRTAPQSNFTGQWQVCSPKTAAGFSAVAYYFGRHLHGELKVPIGLINTSWGGTRAEAWTPDDAIRGSKELKPLVNWWDGKIKEYPPEKLKRLHDEAIKKWDAAVKKAKAAGKKPPAKPRPVESPAESRHRPANLYNGMIHPLIPFAIRGAIWYQGESNVPRSYQYRTIFPLMINSWRKRWGQGDFPFYFVQLAPYRYGWAGSPQHCPELWGAQLYTLRTVKHTGMAVTTDIGNPRDIHPTNKQDVGKRLALWALAKDYGKKVAYSGPLYQKLEVKGDRAILFFDEADALFARDSKPLTHFTIAGKDRKFHPAEAKIEGKTVVVTSDKVKQPVAVRFGWIDTASPNLVNGAGLPASPFRTDDWPAVTQGVTTPQR